VHGNEVFLGNVGGLGNGCGYIRTLGNADTDAVLAVAHNNEGAEAEATAALYYAGYAVDVQYALIELLFFRSNLGPTAVTARAAALTTAATAVVPVVASLVLLVLLSRLCFGCCSWGWGSILSHG